MKISLIGTFELLKKLSLDNLFRRSLGRIMQMVPGAGIEPARPLKAQDFKSCVSTNFTIRAKRDEEREIIYYR